MAPTFILGNSWRECKVLLTKNQDPKVGISSGTNVDNATKRLRQLKIQYSPFYGLGYRSGLQEARELRIPSNVINAADYVMHLQQPMSIRDTASDLAATFAFGMAGFHSRPFYLKRNTVSPPLSLQRQVFPFIEGALYGPGTLLHQTWVDMCDRTMAESQDTVDPFAQEDASEFDKADLADKRDFLLMLMRMRRVILQDAAAYIHGGM